MFNIKERLPEFVLTRKEIAMLRSIKKEDLGYGYDKFGMDISMVVALYATFAPLYNHYFQVESFGHENVPTAGPAVLVANNAGTVAYDGLILLIDMLKELDPPRLARTIVDRSVSDVPFLNVLLQRCGQVIGTHRNFDELLQLGELVITFPESKRGLKKKWRDRHKLEQFNVGFLELAYRNKIPLIPTAIITREGNKFEQGMRRILQPLTIGGFPPFLVPLPMKYSIYYGEPLLLHKIVDSYFVNQPELLQEVVDEMRRLMQELIDRGLSECGLEADC
jgi:1-acyl-sn-glycerol-3-phosphate acyltransferase